MRPATLDIWVWTLIYGGLLAVGLGLAVQSSHAALGWSVVVVGGVLAVVGAALIVVRARMTPPPAPRDGARP
jgi:hypothetical protein